MRSIPKRAPNQTNEMTNKTKTPNDTPNDLWQWLQRALLKYHDKPAWICRITDGSNNPSKRIITYAQLHHAALQTATQLQQRNIKDGGRIAIIAPNGPEFTVAALAAWKIGASVAPIHFANSQYEITQQIRALAPQIILHHQTAHTLPKSLPTLAINLPEAATPPEKPLPPPPPSTPRPANHPHDKLAVRIYTSGSTGQSKIVRLSHANLISNVLATRHLAKFTPRDRFLSLLPLSHAMGLMGTLLLPLQAGCAIVTPSVLTASEVLTALHQENISVLIAVPKLFRNIMLGLEKKFQHGGRMLKLYRALLAVAPLPLRRLLNLPLRKKLGKNMKIWVSGGSHLDPRISRYYHTLGLPLRQGYGLTETSPLVSIQENFDPAVASVGKAVPGVEVKIHNPDANGTGEVWIKGANVMLGYETRAQTAEAMQGDWFKSGDIGHIDSHARIFLSGRAKRLIVTESGKNVYPEELETLLERNPAVKEAAVLEIKHAPACVLAMQDADSANSADSAASSAKRVLRDFNKLVSSHNRISRFAVVDELPRTPLGKTALAELPAVFAKNETTTQGAGK